MGHEPLCSGVGRMDLVKMYHLEFQANLRSASWHLSMLCPSDYWISYDNVQVTRLLAELRMDRDSLIAGLLHDTVEDNPGQITFEEIGVSTPQPWHGLASMGESQLCRSGYPANLLIPQGGCRSAARPLLSDLASSTLAVSKSLGRFWCWPVGLFLCLSSNFTTK